MIAGLLGEKIGMSQVFQDDGNKVPVTIVKVAPGVIVQIKTPEKDGYNAVKIGFQRLEEKKANKVSQPARLQFKDLGVYKYLKEFPATDYKDLAVGNPVGVSLFSEGQLVDVSAKSKGRGFQGVVKRHNFAGGPASHGHRFHRTTGSIGNRKFPGRVFKNKRMPGHMGNKRITLQNLKISRIDEQNNLLFLVGSVPGSKGSLLELRRAVKA